MYARDLFESKYQLPINGRERIGTKKWKNSKGFIDYSQIIDDVYGNLENTIIVKILIVFDDTIEDMEANEKLSHIITDLLLRERELNISLFFISKSYFKVPKTIWLNVKHYYVMKIPNKKELQQMAWNHSSDIVFENCMKLDKGYTKIPYSFIVIDTTLPSNSLLRFKKNLL